MNSIVVEKRTETSNSARAVLINSNTMEHMRRLGLERALLDSSYPRNQPMTLAVGTSLLGENPLVTSHFASWGDAIDGLDSEKKMLLGFTSGDTAFPAIFCPQYEQERVLKEHLETKSNVKLLWGKVATSVEDNENGVTVSLIDAQDPTTETVVKGKYLIACDGGRSWVRKQLTVHTLGQFVVRRACSFVISSPEATRELQGANNLGVMVLLTKRYQVISIALNMKGDFAFHVIRPSNSTDDMMNDLCSNAKDHVRFILGKDVPFTIRDAHDYNMHALIATKFKEGHVFFAGDAAHQWLPAGGLGLNTGYQDASDLGWKIAAVVNGWGGPNLLGSFQFERRPIADKTRRFALSIAPPELGARATKIIGTALTKSPLHRFFFYLIGSMGLERAFLLNKDMVLGNQYTDSNIVMHEYEDETTAQARIKTPHKVGKFSQSCLPGSRAPHVVIPESASIHDIFGKGFVLLIIGGHESDCEALQTLLKERKVPFQVFAYPRLPEFEGLYDGKYYLIRPDGIIAWRSHSQPSNHHSRTIVKTVCGDFPLRSVRKVSPSSTGTKAIDFPSSFVSSIGYGFWAAVLARKYTNMSELGAIGTGLGIASLATVFLTKKPSEPFPQKVSRHQAWLMDSFGPADSVLYLESKFIQDFRPKDVLIKVHAASINPIDLRIREGYGSRVLHKLAKSSGVFLPAVLGRDCAGEVVAVGDNAHKFIPGDLVYAACPISDYGTHAQYACINEDYVSLKPVNVSHNEAASLPWVAVTTWTAVVELAGLTEKNTRCKKVLVHGGSGGIGSFAIQMLKSWGAEVTTTCSSENLRFVHGLGADKAVAYTDVDFSKALTKHSYDFVLDTVGLLKNYENPSLSLLKLYSDSKYVSLISPKFHLINKFGPFFGGFLFQWYYRFKIIVNRVFGGRSFYYSYAQPDGKALSKIKEMVEIGDIRPCLSAVYSMDEMIDAHKHLESGSSRGKVVVSFV